MARMNLLFFMSDNHSRDVSGCYGHPLVHTPTLDQLAEAGARFANAYCASPLCCPSRSALATGRFPHQTGYWDNIFAYDGRVTSWMKRLRDAGYNVVSVGKLHFAKTDERNGFSEEIVPMHILDGKGGIKGLLRGYGAALAPANNEMWDLYFRQSGIGTTHYEEYDEEITSRAIAWLETHASSHEPWALFVSYVSPHPPFTVPKRLYDLYPLHEVPLPPRFRPEERATHPAAEYHREIFGTREIDEHSLRHVAASYFALITHVDEQIGKVLSRAESLGVTDEANIVYTSDHGELFGAHGLLGKGILYEGAVAVPLLMAGPSVPKGGVVRELASQVDLYPTLLEGCDVALEDEDSDLPGRSLWSAIRGDESARPCFAEYHAHYSKNGSFMLRKGTMKLVHHVAMPPQLFDLERDAVEAVDLAADAASASTLAALERDLRAICDPEEVDRHAKADQRVRGNQHGGVEKLSEAPVIKFTPPPGVTADVAWSVDK